MDLAKEFKSAVKNPLNFKNLFVIFVTVFLILIVGLSLLTLVKKITALSNKTTACNFPKTISVPGSVVLNKDSVYKLNFEGNNNCLLHVWFTWKELDQKIDLWVYDPKGNVQIVEPTKTQSNLSFTLNTPIDKGNWRFILKSKNKKPISYNGGIAIR